MPNDPHGWKEHGRHQLNAGDLRGAETALARAAELAPTDYGTWLLLGYASFSAGDELTAVDHFQRVLALRADDFDAHVNLAFLFLRQNQTGQSIEHVERALALQPNSIPALRVKAQLLHVSGKYQAAISIFEQLIQQDQATAHGCWNDLGNIKRELGRLDEALDCYRKAAGHSGTSSVALSNQITLLHYMPDRDPSEIFELCKKWGQTFAPAKGMRRPRPADRCASRPLNIGMISDGFRQHPVGAMITPALAHLRNTGLRLHLYTSSSAVDSVTEQIQAAADRWIPIFNKSDDELAALIRGDGIDILIDLSGHNTGTRMRTIAMEPAPVIVKWVGGLINTTGVEAIDYLITDTVESPPGSDASYTEKLIRMPDDYICYMPPQHVPEVGPLPALRNGYVTFGCFNNPTKVNETVLGHWARLLRAVPDSRLYLKSSSFGTEDLRKRTLDVLATHGIDSKRVRMEGQSAHYDLLNSYNEVDIALDPWPYSGGLTTCEALLMGVPVISLPGPTFAGRHSATHLINAGMPELVVSNWSEYLARAVELASDLQSLSTIREHLRQILLQSPVCDGAKFARHLSDALRAIWQRYCEEKPPAALAFTPEGRPWFETEDAPSVLTHPAPPPPASSSESFQFELQGKIVTLDHGGSFIHSERFAGLSRLKALATIAMDPTGVLSRAAELIQDGSLQHYDSKIALGDGTPTRLHACLDTSFSGTLEPLPAAEQVAALRQGTTVLTTLPVPTAPLDSISGLGQLDWLILDDRHDTLRIIEGASAQLDNALLVQARILFLPLYTHQPDLGLISGALARHGLRLLRLKNPRHLYCSPALQLAKKAFDGSQLLSADAIFIPTDDRLKNTERARVLKLAFLLHTVYEAPDAAHAALQLADEDTASHYLVAGGWAPPPKARIVRAPELLLSKKAKHRAVVGVPTYNEEKYIAQTIQSLKDQDADGVRFLISDNCSTDRTIEIIQDLATGDARFEVFQHESNLGAAKNFAFVLQNSASDYFMWLGAHDYLSPDYVSKVVRRLDQNPHLSMVLGSPYSVNGSHVQSLPSAIYDFSSQSPAQRYLDSVIALANCTIVQAMFRRVHLDDYEIREVRSGDHVLISHLLWKGYLEYLDGPKYYRRYFAEARMNTASERITGKKIELPLEGLYQHYREDLANLSKDVMAPEEIEKLQEIVQSVLRRRFGGAPTAA